MEGGVEVLDGGALQEAAQAFARSSKECSAVEVFMPIDAALMSMLGALAGQEAFSKMPSETVVSGSVRRGPPWMGGQALARRAEFLVSGLRVGSLHVLFARELGAERPKMHPEVWGWIPGEGELRAPRELPAGLISEVDGQAVAGALARHEARRLGALVRAPVAGSDGGRGRI